MTYVSIVDTYLDELKRCYGVGTDEALASRLKVGKSTLATWRRRGAIPYEVYGDLHPDPVDYFLIIRRHLAAVLAASDAGLKMLLLAAIRIGAQGGLGDKDAAGWADWLAANRRYIFEDLVKLDEVGRSGEAISDDYVNRRLMDLIMGGSASGVFAPDMLRKLRHDMD